MCQKLGEDMPPCTRDLLKCYVQTKRQVFTGVNSREWLQQGVVAHTFNSPTREAGVGGWLCVQGQSDTAEFQKAWTKVIPYLKREKKEEEEEGRRNQEEAQRRRRRRGEGGGVIRCSQDMIPACERDKKEQGEY